MSLKVIDGLRTVDGANSGIDMAIQAIIAGNTVNGASHDMKDHFEFLAICINDDTDVGATLTFRVQESNDNSTFTNITGASAAVASNTANTVELISVNWKHPDRQRYARVTATVSGANNGDCAVVGLRLQANAGDIDVDDNVAEVE